MELYSTSSDVARADLVDADGHTVYRMTTEYSSFNKSNSTIARFVPQGNGPQPAVIAAIVWHNFRDDEIIYHGQQRKAKSLIRTRGVWTEKREFIGTSGRAYCWKEGLLYVANDIEVARWHNKSHSTFSGHAHQAYLQIANPDVLNDLDDIIIVMIYHLSKLAEDRDSEVMAAGVRGTVFADA